MLTAALQLEHSVLSTTLMFQSEKCWCPLSKRKADCLIIAIVGWL